MYDPLHVEALVIWGHLGSRAKIEETDSLDSEHAQRKKERKQQAYDDKRRRISYYYSSSSTSHSSFLCKYFYWGVVPLGI